MAPSSPRHPYRVVLVGAGRVGTAVSLLLALKGNDIVGVASRTQASAQRAAALLGSTAMDMGERLPESNIVLIGAGDAAIETVAVSLVPSVGPGTIVCHFAGSLGIEPLTACADVGADVVAAHPVQACPDVETAVARLPGSAWGITCAPHLTEWARGFVRAELDGAPQLVDEKDRPLWHAAAVLTANGIAGLLSAGEEILKRIGISDPIRVLGPLAEGAVANAADRDGGAATLTGPVVRGELATIRRHLTALIPHPELLEIYRLVSSQIVLGARASGRLSDELAGRITELLEST